MDYNDDDNVAILKTFFAPGLRSGFTRLATTRENPIASLPPASLTLQRRLFPGADTFGVFECSTNSGLPTFTLALSSQNQLDLAVEEEKMTPTGPPTRTGLSLCLGHWSIGASVLGFYPVMFGECGAVLAELGVKLKARLEATLQAQDCVLSASWNGESSTSLSRVGAEARVGMGGVSLKLGSVDCLVFCSALMRLTSHFTFQLHVHEPGV